MDEHLYRFRSTKALLGDRQELERQEIYFASAQELNDSLEGYLDVVWRGDEILWENLIRHYLLCLIQSASFAALAPDESREKFQNFIYQTRQDIIGLPLAEFHASFCADLLDEGPIQRALHLLSGLQHSIGRAELTFYLWLIHPYALSTLLKKLHGSVPSSVFVPELDVGLFDLLTRISNVALVSDAQSSASFENLLNATSQLMLISDYNQRSAQSASTSWHFVSRHYPSFYVETLENLMYPRARVACFSSNPKNASMWGSYADSHRGVCLKFKPTGKDGQQYLTLRRNIHSYTHAPDRPLTATSQHKIETVRYDGERPEIEFFSSIGRVQRFKLKDWLQSAASKLSPLVKEIHEENAEWRERYWERFNRSVAVKTKEWAHEQEKRLVLSSPFDEENPSELAKGFYEFSDLSGIIFGVRTTSEQKFEIMQIIEAKCRQTKRSNFEFFQARHTSRGSGIDIIPLSLLRFHF